jgi:hypothetical protein
MSIPGYQKDVLIATSSTASYTQPPATSATLTLAGDVLDDTTIQSTGFRSRLIGLRDWSISIPSLFESTNTAFGQIRSAWFNRTTLSVQYLPDGTNGFLGTVYVETFSHSGDVGGIESVDINLVAESQLSTI